MNHDCNEPYAESTVVFDERLKLWRLSLDRHHSSEPISHCPFCGDKLPFKSSDIDAYREGERAREEKAKRSHEEIIERIKNNPSPDRDTDDVPEQNPLKSP